MDSSYTSLCIIVPFISNQVDELLRFDEKHDFFIRKGGRVIYKSCGKINSDLSKKIIKRNTVLIEKNDESLYEAWNQSMEFLEKKLEISNDHYVIWLGLDDELNEKFIEDACRINRDGVYYDFIYGDAIASFNSSHRYLKSNFPPRLFSNNNFSFDIFHPGLLNRWEIIKGRRFDTRYKLAADLDFYIGISKSSRVTFKKIPRVQACIGSDGVSQSFSAKKIYLQEWREIEARRNVNIKKDHVRSLILSFLASYPLLYSTLRKLYWKFFYIK